MNLTQPAVDRVTVRAGGRGFSRGSALTWLLATLGSCALTAFVTANTVGDPVPGALNLILVAVAAVCAVLVVVIGAHRRLAEQLTSAVATLTGQLAELQCADPLYRELGEPAGASTAIGAHPIEALRPGLIPRPPRVRRLPTAGR